MPGALGSASSAVVAPGSNATGWSGSPWRVDTFAPPLWAPLEASRCVRFRRSARSAASSGWSPAGRAWRAASRGQVQQSSLVGNFGFRGQAPPAGQQQIHSQTDTLEHNGALVHQSGSSSRGPAASAAAAPPESLVNNYAPLQQRTMRAGRSARLIRLVVVVVGLAREICLAARRSALAADGRRRTGRDETHEQRRGKSKCAQEFAQPSRRASEVNR